MQDSTYAMDDCYDACGNLAIDASGVQEGLLIRVTREQPPRVCVVDLVVACTGASTFQARRTLMPNLCRPQYAGVPREVADRAHAVLDVLYDDKNVYKFKGRGQRFSPVATGEAAKDLVRAYFSTDQRGKDVLAMIELWSIDVVVNAAHEEQLRASDEARLEQVRMDERRRGMQTCAVELQRQTRQRNLELRGIELQEKRLRKV